ncbi:MAG: hypothetical protein R3A44_42655 [Caldilineaceae bacterium]
MKDVLAAAQPDPYVLGRVARLALQVGTELVFSPVYHPASNGYIERFHQEYDLHVWEDTYLANQAQVSQQAVQFSRLIAKACIIRPSTNNRLTNYIGWLCL